MLTDSQYRSAKCKDKPYKLTKGTETKENLFAIGDYASAPAGASPWPRRATSAPRPRSGWACPV